MPRLNEKEKRTFIPTYLESTHIMNVIKALELHYSNGTEAGIHITIVYRFYESTKLNKNTMLCSGQLLSHLVTPTPRLTRSGCREGI